MAIPIIPISQLPALPSGVSVAPAQIPATIGAITYQLTPEQITKHGGEGVFSALTVTGGAVVGGSLAVGGAVIINAAPTAPAEATNKAYVDALVASATAGGPFIPASEKGAASGVATLDITGFLPTAYLHLGVPGGIATLDSGGVVPLAQVPDLSGLYIVLGQKGAANGVATLDAGSKVPVVQLPDLSGTYILVAQKGAPGGVATLDGGGKVPAAQLPDTAAGVYIPLTQKGAANGVATLDAGGFVPDAQIPAVIARDDEAIAYAIALG